MNVLSRRFGVSNSRNIGRRNIAGSYHDYKIQFHHALSYHRFNVGSHLFKNLLCSHRMFSSTTTTGEGSTNKDPVVTLTQTSKEDPPKSASESGSESESDNQNQQQNQHNKPKKSSQQIAEEELYELMSESRQHYQHSNYTEALSTANEFLTQATTLFGPKHPAVASAHNNVGLMNKMIGEYSKSRESYHTALSIYQTIVGEDHENYAATLHNLGVLDKTQAFLDDELKQIEKMTFVDRAVEYLEKAVQIREVELGIDHVHTVSSRSNLGNSIAAQVIMSETMRQKQARKRLEDAKAASSKDSDLNGREEEEIMKSLRPMSKFTVQKWELAEKHLREALRTAIDNPRGEVIHIESFTSTSTKRKMKKGTARQRKMAMKNNPSGETQQQQSSNSSSEDSPYGIGDTTIRTISSAHAAQSLAVFLKTRGDLISSSDKLQSPSDNNTTLDSGDMYAEAKNLYIGALRVRTKLKGESHPDTVASKFSLAELIDTLGDEEGANKLRQELLDVYQVEERDGISTVTPT